MPAKTIHPRFSKQLLLDAIADTPVVLIHGSRQCGKTTLAVELGEELGHHYLTFDDYTQRQAALADPIGFIKSLPEFTILDEIQRVPELFTAIKPVLIQTGSLVALSLQVRQIYYYFQS